MNIVCPVVECERVGFDGAASSSLTTIFVLIPCNRFARLSSGVIREAGRTAPGNTIQEVTP